MATNAVSTAPSSSPRTQRIEAPDTAITPRTSALMTSAVPRSGCSMTNASGTAEKASTSITSVLRGTSSASRFSDSSIAMPTTSATLASSDGCSEKPAGNTIHECEPLMVTPSGDSTATRPTIEST